jgi:hypothetical protein
LSPRINLQIDNRKGSYVSKSGKQVGGEKPAAKTKMPRALLMHWLVAGKEVKANLTLEAAFP